ncbi:MAG: hypothetical protein AAF439_13415 [Pseudomonadota bacterium]
MTELKQATLRDLLSLHTGILEELRDRGITRSANNITGDLGEYLFCLAFGWAQAPNSEKGFDAVDNYGHRYQIKARRIHRRNGSRQLSAIRDFASFDQLAAVLFDDEFHIFRAALIPREIVKSQSTYHAHTNSYRFLLRDQIWETPGVLDVTDQLQRVTA